MRRTLSELGFASRQALIVVPRNQATQPHRVRPSTNMTTSNDSNGGYFDYVKRVLSYVNPFSYLGGNSSSSNSETVARTDGPWQHSKNPTYSFMLFKILVCMFIMDYLMFPNSFFFEKRQFSSLLQF